MLLLMNEIKNPENLEVVFLVLVYCLMLSSSQLKSISPLKLNGYDDPLMQNSIQICL